MSRFYLAVLTNGRAEVIEVPAGENPNYVASDHCVLDSYTVKSEANERCEVENDPVRRELLVTGKLKVHKTA